MVWYPWIVFLHVAGTLIFFLAHGTSMAVAFRLKQERDPARIRALLDVSSWSLGVVPSIAFIIGIVAGIWAGIAGGHFGRIWIWLAMVVLAAIAAYMTPGVAARLTPMREAAGTRQINPFSRRPPGAPPEPNPAELERLVAAWNPWPAAIIGLAGFLFILWLMLFKPF